MKVLLVCTGSVASVKVPALVLALQAANFEVRVVATSHSLHFFDRSTVSAEILTDEDEWRTFQSLGDPVLHISLRNWADLLLVAPLDAHTLAKISTGQADNLATCVARAWDFGKPFIVCPAMNTFMWEHPITAPQLATLASWGATQVTPVVKTLACGDVGCGAMAEVPSIVSAVVAARL